MKQGAGGGRSGRRSGRHPPQRGGGRAAALLPRRAPGPGAQRMRAALPACRRLSPRKKKKKEWSKPKECIGIVKTNNIYKNHRRWVKEDRKQVPSNDSWNLPKLELRKWHPYSWGRKILRLNTHKKTALRHIIIKLRSQNQKGNFIRSKRKVTCHKQGKHHKTLVENFSDQEKMD